MFAFPEMLISAAKAENIKVPQDLESWIQQEYPHFTVFCTMQLGTPMPYPGVHFDNAKIIASFSDEQIMTITREELIERGFQIGYPSH